MFRSVFRLAPGPKCCLLWNRRHFSPNNLLRHSSLGGNQMMFSAPCMRRWHSSRIFERSHSIIVHEYRRCQHHHGGTTFCAASWLRCLHTISDSIRYMWFLLHYDTFNCLFSPTVTICDSIRYIWFLLNYDTFNCWFSPTLTICDSVPYIWFLLHYDTFDCLFSPADTICDSTSYPWFLSTIRAIACSVQYP